MQVNSVRLRDWRAVGISEGVAVELVNLGISLIHQEFDRLQSDRFRSDMQAPLRPFVAFCDKQKGISCE